MNSRQNDLRRAFAPLVLGLALLGLSGCGGGVGEVSGKVTYKGKTVPLGYVVFYGSDQRTYEGAITEGAYRVAVPTGDALVAVISDDPSLGKKPPPNSKDPKPRQVQKTWPPEIEKKWFRLPAHSREHLQSGLTFTVRQGENTFDINLVDESPKAK